MGRMRGVEEEHNDSLGVQNVGIRRPLSLVSSPGGAAAEEMRSCEESCRERRAGVTRIFVSFLLLCNAAAAPHCSFPKQFSHRNKHVDGWLASRGETRVSDDGRGRQWSRIHKLLNSQRNSSDWELEKAEAQVEEFTKWISAITQQPSFPERVSVAYVQRPWWRADGSQALSSFASNDLRQGDTILHIPVGLCMSDIWTTEDPKSLYGAPWEVRLATKLLRERSKGSRSQWVSYIKLLPSFVPLPMFFSDLEMINIQDRIIEEEVYLVRKYARATFQALHASETAGAKFSEYVWALSVVYSSVCQVDETDARPASISAHYLVPFFGSNFRVKDQVYVEHVDEGLKIVARDVTRGTPLAAEYISSTLRDTFIFRGFVPKISHQEKITLFRDVLDLVDWYSSAHGAVNNNRYLTWRLARDTVKTLDRHSQQLNPQLIATGAELSIGANGFIHPYVISILATLNYAKKVIVEETSVQAFTTIDLITGNGTTPWDGVLTSIALETTSRYRWNTMDCKTSLNSSFELAFSSAKALIQDRLLNILEGFSTDLEEDQVLLNVATWEGLNELEDDQLPCPSCRWQTEQMSYHDNLALQFRFSMKTFISGMAYEVTCGSDKRQSSIQTQEADWHDSKMKTLGTREENSSLQEFLKWCEGHDLMISGRLAIKEIMVSAKGEHSLREKVRGVVALKDIHQGETLCSLPMDVGLFNNDSSSVDNPVDAWDFAAARLLRERAKGKESSWAPYIAILPEHLSTPIKLQSREIREVQWWPVMRELVQVRKAIRESFSKLSRAEVAWAEYSEYEWAVTMVHSRAFTLPVKADEQYDQYVLMPFMDMINHHYRYQADWMSQPVWDGKLDIIAKRNIKKGEELFASFGPRSNDNLFLYYGFVLEDNPFDSVQLFGSFEEALNWFLQLWTRNCVNSTENSVAESLCQQKSWQSHWSQVKHTVEEISSGSGAQGREWAELLTYWADLGFQFLPYQPGPTIYPGGIVDPSFLVVFSSFHEVIHSLRKHNEIDSAWPDPCTECSNNTAIGSSAIRQFFACLDNHHPPIRGLLDGHSCEATLTQVLLTEQMLPRPALIARISVALRCLEILASLPTTIDEDRELLKKRDCNPDEPPPCGTTQTLNPLLQLTTRYRYLKKLLLRAPIDKLLARD